jgi:L-threonylcarbamoyladenylate synthase
MDAALSNYDSRMLQSWLLRAATTAPGFYHSRVKIDPGQIKAAAEELLGGGVIAFPTETVYGLAAVATDAAAVAKVFALKGRPANNPLIVHVADEAMTRIVTGDWPKLAGVLAAAFWPGPLSIVVPRADSIPSIVTGGGPTVCVRCPDHPVAMALIEAVGTGLVGPSANQSGGISPTTAAHVSEAFPEIRVLDGGACRVGIESTVVRVVDGAIEVLRPGVIGAGELERVAGSTVRVPRVEGAIRSGPMASPGLLIRHYAPGTPTAVVAVADELDLADAVVLAQLPFASCLCEAGAVIEMPGDADAYAAVLYDALRRADAMGFARIVVLSPTGPGERAVWDAVADRLRRACAEDRGGA